MNIHIASIAFNNVMLASHLINRFSRNVSALLFNVGPRHKQDHGTEHWNILVIHVHEDMPLRVRNGVVQDSSPTGMKTGSWSIMSQHQQQRSGITHPRLMD